MKVAIRVDASQWIGSGHVMRCLVLADELCRIGHEIVFVCLPQTGDKRPLIRERGFAVIELTSPAIEVVPQSSDDYLAWLQRSVDEDAEDFICRVDDIDLVITDHYAIGSEWQTKVKNALGCQLIAIDDLKRYHDAELIIDQTLGRLPVDYGAGADVLAGTDYALLNPLFYNSRNRALDKTLNSIEPKILISMGGVDQPNATMKALKGLKGFKGASFTVLLGPSAPHYCEVVEFCSSNVAFEHIDFVNDMAGLMLGHDASIGAPGTTSWERACLGLPSIIIPIADNQNEIANKLVEYEIAFCAALDTLETELAKTLLDLLGNLETLRNASFRACDGLGVYRVATEIDQLKAGCLDYRLVKAAPNDIRQVYEWQCHSETRKYALNPNVPDWEEHQAWMSKKLSNNYDFFYLITDVNSSQKVGVVRLDKIVQLDYLVSIFIAPQHYSKGIASQALRLVGSVHPMINIHATVLKENVASQRLFEKAEYERVSPEKFIRRAIV